MDNTQNTFFKSKWLWVFLLLFSFAGGIALMKWWNGLGEHQAKKEADLILQQVKTVSKLVTVEGNFSEIYRHEDYWGTNWSLFKKKALIRVKAKVLAGYDLSNMKMEADEKNKILKITNIGTPKILAIDHTLDYFDMNNGLFNSFKAEDYTRLGEEAKNFVSQHATKSGLLASAKHQTNVVFGSVRSLAQGMGWKVEIEGESQSFSN
jgi:hypothetical protein